MELLVATIRKETETLIKNNIIEENNQIEINNQIEMFKIKLLERINRIKNIKKIDISSEKKYIRYMSNYQNKDIERKEPEINPVIE